MPITEERNTITSVLCVDDNQAVAAAVREILARVGGFKWCGWLPDTSNLVGSVSLLRPSLILLDIDIPGPGVFDVLSELGAFSECRVIMFSGHVSRDLIEQALDRGAWGYILKSDGNDALVRCLREVAASQLGFTPEPRRLYSGQ